MQMFDVVSRIYWHIIVTVFMLIISIYLLGSVNKSDKLFQYYSQPVEVDFSHGSGTEGFITQTNYREYRFGAIRVCKWNINLVVKCGPWTVE